MKFLQDVFVQLSLIAPHSSIPQLTDWVNSLIGYRTQHLSVETLEYLWDQIKEVTEQIAVCVKGQINVRLRLKTIFVSSIEKKGLANLYFNLTFILVAKHPAKDQISKCLIFFSYHTIQAVSSMRNFRTCSGKNCKRSDFPNKKVVLSVVIVLEEEGLHFRSFVVYRLRK